MPDDGPHSPNLADLEGEMSRLLDSYRLAPTTERDYDRYWNIFTDWCASVGRSPLPADDETVAAFLAQAVPGRYADGSVAVMLAAIADRHRRANHRPPPQTLAKQTRDGIAKVEGRPVRRPRPLTADLTELAASAAPEASVGTLRARALLLVGHAGEVAHTQLRHLERRGIERLGERLFVAVPGNTRHRRHLTARAVELTPTGDARCPVAALEALLAVTGAPRPFALSATTSLIRLRTAAARAGTELAMDPYPAHGLAPTDLWRVVMHVSWDSVIFVRDRAYLLLLHAGPFHKSEPLGLCGADLEETEAGLIIHLPWAPPDRFGRHEYVMIPRAPDAAACPVAAVAEWRRLRRIGPSDLLFSPTRSKGTRRLGSTTARSSVRRLTERAGLGAVSPGDVRRGFFVSASEAGESLLAITMAARVKRLETTRTICGAVAPERRRAPRALGL